VLTKTLLVNYISKLNVSNGAEVSTRTRRCFYRR